LTGHRIISSRSRYRLHDYYKFPDFSTALTYPKSILGYPERCHFFGCLLSVKKEEPGFVPLGRQVFSLLVNSGDDYMQRSMGPAILCPYRSYKYFPTKLGMKSAIIRLKLGMGLKLPSRVLWFSPFSLLA
jgi:hypothetical protein